MLIWLTHLREVRTGKPWEKAAGLLTHWLTGSAAGFLSWLPRVGASLSRALLHPSALKTMPTGPTCGRASSAEAISS